MSSENLQRLRSEDLEKPPYDASPEHIMEICHVLVEGDTGVKEIIDNVSLSKQPVHRNIQYGKQLGFIREMDEKHITLTERGEMLVHSNAIDWVYRKAISDYPLYRNLLKLIFEQNITQNVREEVVITQSKLHEVLEEQFDFTLGDRSLKSAVRTFFRTLAAAEYGVYVRGDGEYPTRIEFDLETLEEALPNDLKLRVEKIRQQEPDKTAASDDVEMESQERIIRFGAPDGQSEFPIVFNINVDFGNYEKNETTEEIKQFISELGWNLEKTNGN